MLRTQDQPASTGEQDQTKPAQMELGTAGEVTRQTGESAEASLENSWRAQLEVTEQGFSTKGLIIQFWVEG